jgi:antitoxin PrlF
LSSLQDVHVNSPLSRALEDFSEIYDFSEKFNSSIRYAISVVEAMNNDRGCCTVDAVVTLDSKGQIVLPKDLRERAKLKPDDKLAVIGCEREGEICCIMMIKAEDLGKTVRVMLGPILKEIFK